MKVQIKANDGTLLTIQRPHGIKWGMRLTMSKGDGEDPVLDMEIDQENVQYLEKAISLFT